MKSRTDSEDASLAKLRSEKDEPKWAKSSTETEEASRL